MDMTLYLNLTGLVIRALNSGRAPFTTAAMTACRRLPNRMVRSYVTGGAATCRPMATAPEAVMCSIAASGCRQCCAVCLTCHVLWRMRTCGVAQPLSSKQMRPFSIH